MPRYRAMVKCFVDNSLRDEGDVFEYNGPANPNLELADGSDEPTTRPSGKTRQGGSDAAQGRA